MKRGIRITVLGICLFLGLLAGLTGCSGSEEQQIKSGYKIYYVNSEENNVVKQSYKVASKDTEGMIDEFLEALRDGGDSAEYRAACPEPVKLLEYNLNEETLSLKFSIDYESMQNATEVLMRAAYVKTLVQIPGVNFVEFYVGEQPLADSNGNVIGAMNEESFIDNSGGQINDYNEETIVLYYANEKGDKLKQTMRSIVYDQNMPLERVVIEKLIQGPSEGSKGLYPTIPSDTKILSLNIKDSVCYVNFSEEFLKLENEVSEEVQIYSVVNSLAELNTVSKVQISINGVSDRTFVDQINFNTVFERNLDIIENIGEEEPHE